MSDTQLSRELSKWWRYDALSSDGEIQSDIVEVDGDVYKCMAKLRKDLAKNGMRFVQAKEVSANEVVILNRLIAVKKLQRNRINPPKGKIYKSHSKPVAIWLMLLVLLAASAYLLLR